MFGGRRIVQEQNICSRSQHRREPLMTIPEMLGDIAVDMLNGGLLAVGERSATDSGQDDAFCEERERALVDASDCFRQKARLHRLTALELVFGSRETGGDLSCKV